MDRIAVLTFDEPEFELSYAGTPNEGWSLFSWLFFTGRGSLSQLDVRMLRRRPARGLAGLAIGALQAARSSVAPVETIFDFLRRENLPATFFGIFGLLDDGSARDLYLPLFRRILAEGHELGLHGYRHRPLDELDLLRSQSLARRHLGVTLATYSSPFGDDRLQTLRLLERYGFVGMRVWDRSLLAIESPVKRVAYDYSLGAVTAAATPIVVVNLHSLDCYPWGFARVKRTVRALKAQGYRFTTFRALCEGDGALPRLRSAS
ncbi:MAG TPA: polysaccharide deacetylase family protein [Phenylobacterium sp.]|uniref:polysaccharide deacetylase family protein n=1 Tax=Phenylobacterium sp. TaxID=1871053 RepID=UPI002B9687CD|nr:polysaccharide deacetylase family protein [Phenylobacterium sp.]HSV03172.1 polysaccharide deacetylase family protein [Phenylobacterium sp.]